VNSEENITISQVGPVENPETCVEILQRSFGTVAVDFGITIENCPSNPAFISTVTFTKQLKEKISFHVLYYNKKPVGTIAIEKSPDQPGVYYIERVAVLPEYRHLGLGKKLMEFATERIILMGGREISIAIIHENRVLKSWYESMGFKETIVRKYDHLPFTVCFMHKLLG
jgi:ribosomal protein S18 acetylase RimI-like enzyme